MCLYRKYFIIVLLLTCLVGCTKTDSQLTEIYLKNSLSLGQRKQWQESKKWLTKLEELKSVDLEKVLSYLNKGDGQFRCFLIETLGNIGDRRSVNPLIELLEKENNLDVKLYTIDALGKLKDPKSVGLLEKYLNDKLWGVRLLAANALENITGKKYKF